MTVEVIPFEAGLGADIRGVDIGRPLTPIARDWIRAAWLDYLVLRFREQPMTDDRHMAFTRQFGQLEFTPAALIEKQYGVKTENEGRRRDTAPEIAVVLNIVEDGKAICGRSKSRPKAELPIFSTCIRPTKHCRRTSRSASTG